MQEQNDNKIIVSVIITTKEESDNISNCLESVIQQDYPKEKIEIIVIDNYSNDMTEEIAKQYTQKVYTKGPERSAQRNFGVKQASGKYILYLDADMTLSKDVISECVEKCLPRRKPKAFLRVENEDYVALYIPERIVNLSSGNFSLLKTGSARRILDVGGFWIKVRDFERSFYNATVIDCVRFTRRDKFLEIGGFDENLTGPEDWDFDRRIKATGKVDIIDAPLYHNEGKSNLKKYLKKRDYYSQFLAKYIQKWGRKDPLIRKQFGLFYRYFGVFIEKEKWKKLLRHPLLFIQVFLLKILVGIVFLMSKLKKIQAAQGPIIK